MHSLRVIVNAFIPVKLLESIDCNNNWDPKVLGVLNLLLQVTAAFLHQLQVLKDQRTQRS